MKANLFFILFVVASVLFGIGAEFKNPAALLFGIVIMVLTVIIALFIFEPEKR